LILLEGLYVRMEFGIFGVDWDPRYGGTSHFPVFIGPPMKE